MKQLLINALEQICPGNVFLQGTLLPDQQYPETFITFWTNYSDDKLHYDDSTISYEWNFSVMLYSSNPTIVNTKPADIISALKSVGFIPQGKGNDILSDQPTHTGWAMEFIYEEFI